MMQFDKRKYFWHHNLRKMQFFLSNYRTKPRHMDGLYLGLIRPYYRVLDTKMPSHEADRYKLAYAREIGAEVLNLIDSKMTDRDRALSFERVRAKVEAHYQ